MFDQTIKNMFLKTDSEKCKNLNKSQIKCHHWPYACMFFGVWINFFLFFFSFPPNFFDIFIIYKNKEKILSLLLSNDESVGLKKICVWFWYLVFVCVVCVCWNIYFIIIIVPCLDPVDLKIIVFEEFNLVRRHEMNENENITRFGQK